MYRAEQVQILKSLGVQEFILGDMCDQCDHGHGFWVCHLRGKSYGSDSSGKYQLSKKLTQ